MALWTPADLATAPFVWIDGDAAVFSGSNLSSISAKGANAGAMTVSGTPTKATLNGLNGIVFDAGGEKISRILGAFGSSGQFFAFAVVNAYARVNDGTFYGLFHKGSAAPSGSVFVSVDAFNDGSSNGYSYSTGDGWEYATRGPTQDIAYTPAPVTTPTLYAVQLGLTNNYYVNASAASITLGAENSTASFPNHASAQWDFGEGWAGSAEVFNGEVFQILVLSAWPSTDDRQKIEGWAAWKYGLQAKLPVGHPYASFPPSSQTTGTGASPLSPVVGAGAGTVTAPSVTGTGASTLSMQAAGTGARGAAGTATATLAAIGSGSGTAAAPGVTGAGASTLVIQAAATGASGARGIGSAALTISSAGQGAIRVTGLGASVFSIFGSGSAFVLGEHIAWPIGAPQSASGAPVPAPSAQTASPVPAQGVIAYPIN